MGSPTEGAFTPLPLLASTLENPSSSRCRVRVRVSRIWVASDPNKCTNFGLDCLLIDDEGVTMHARAFPSDIDRFQRQLSEGKVYALSDFDVRPRLEYYMACRNGLMINMRQQTVVDEIKDDDTCSSIPLHSFEFVDFGHASHRNLDKKFLSDFIGQIVSIEEMGKTWQWKTLRYIYFRNIHLRDIRGNQLIAVLYGDLGRNFDAEQVFSQGRQVPIVAVFTGMLVQLYPDIGFTVRSTSASKYYLDLDIPEVQEFHASLADPHKPIDRLPCQIQNPVNPTELVKSWRTIKELSNLNPHELEKSADFLCRATLKGIDCTKGWSYQSCFHCKKSISGDGSKFFCNRGCPDNQLPVHRYKLNASIEDATGAMEVMIFDDAEELVGVAAEVLVGNVTEEGISVILCSHRSRVFVVGASNGCFVVKGVLKDDDMNTISDYLSQEEGSSSSFSSSLQVQKVEDDLSQEEGSSASYSSSLQVKKVEGDLSQEDGSSASYSSSLQVKKVEGELSQEEGSSASYSSKSQVKKEIVEIKEQREQKRLKTGNNGN